MPVELRHAQNAARARILYLDNLKPVQASEDWHLAKRNARKIVANALRASKYLADIPAALRSNGGHALAFRQMLAPPLSQDQFKLVCPSWNKNTEVKSRPIISGAAIVGGAIVERLDRGVVKWALGTRPNSRKEVITLLQVAATLIAAQTVATARRSRLAFEQENAVVDLLTSRGWTKLPSRLIDTRGEVPAKSFMRKSRFATATTAHQEVDIACGLGSSYVLAMECKVTNDETNSVKRINDVLKKAAAWKNHWGSFVVTAALLQGVIAAKDVQRLTDGGVEVFWSHDLKAFSKWVSNKISTNKAK